MRVPYISLGAEECLAGIASVNFGVYPLYQFPEAGDSQDEDNAEHGGGSDAIDQSATPEQLGNGNATHAHHEVCHSVIVVSLKPEQVGDKIEGDEFKGVVCSDNLDEAPDTQDDIGCV